MYFPTFVEAIQYTRRTLLEYGQEVDPGRWQGYHTEGKPDLITKEVMNLVLDVPVGRPLRQVAEEIEPNLPWANLEFEERVAREPRNPHHSLDHWPWWEGGSQKLASMVIDGEQFSHTYSERFWPGGYEGIRYHYGNLDDVVSLLIDEPATRQATFPIFFPEDTGAVHRGRIPCTLHYHFMVRNNRLHMWYPIRSCDYVRHFRDDLYMAVRLMDWVMGECSARDPQSRWDNLELGMLHFSAYSMHYHMGDAHHVRP